MKILIMHFFPIFGHFHDFDSSIFFNTRFSKTDG
jgi:hypothetical protein